MSHGRPPKQHKVEVFVTNSDNQSGHVSVSLTDGADRHHTSFSPKGLLSKLVNGLSFGSVAVPGHVERSHVADKKSANVILKKEISEKQYKDMRKEQKKIDNEVSSGNTTYSVLERYNPLASFTSRLLHAPRLFNRAAATFEARTGFPLAMTEDHFGNVMDAPGDMGQSQAAVHNCTSITTRILNKGGFNVNNPVIPTLYTDELRDKGFDATKPRRK